MKKFLCVLLSAVLTSATFSLVGCGTPREQLLKLYMPGEYIDETIFADFETWYEKETGDKIKVQIEIGRGVV